VKECDDAALGELGRRACVSDFELASILSCGSLTIDSRKRVHVIQVIAYKQSIILETSNNCAGQVGGEFRTSFTASRYN
jgi:hypothetical protein